MSKKVNGMIADNPKLMAFFDAENIQKTEE